MSAREWKPGDVAMVNDVTRTDAPWLAATCTAAAKPGEREAEWMLHRSGARVWGSVSKARPLVVIDPEDREQVVRFVTLYCENYGGTYEPEGKHRRATDSMQAALRTLANPKPEEPTGLGAVVEAIDGALWLRHVGQLAPWHRGDAAPSERAWRYWSEIAAVKVLSEGVTA